MGHKRVVFDPREQRSSLSSSKTLRGVGKVGKSLFCKEGTLNQIFFYVEIYFWKVTKISDFFLK